MRTSLSRHGLATLALAIASACPLPARGANGHWQPPNITPSTATLQAVLARTATAAGAPDPGYADRVETWNLTADGAQLKTQVTVRGADVRFDTALDGATYAQGRVNGIRWRMTPNGLVRTIAADVQGDDLDRWPLAFFPYAAADCALLGEVARPARYVVEYRPAHDSPHWFFIDETTGLVTREEFREGSRDVAFDFADYRTTNGTMRPFAWHVSGAGPAADVLVAAVKPQAVAPAAVALPVSSDDAAARFTDGAHIPLDLRHDRFTIDATVNGHRGRFIFDTGTTQLLIAGESARRFGLHPVLGHATAASIVVGHATFTDAAIMTVPLARFGDDGIFGYDFFVGHVVHVDYQHGRIDFIDRSQFVPPPAAVEIPTDVSEGMPLVTATIGSLTSSRVALDTGSYDVVVLRALAGTDFRALAADGITNLHGTGGIAFLEGGVTTTDADLSKLDFANRSFVNDEIEVETQNPGPAVDFPIDAIFGTQVLHLFEWWFDYDANRIWLR